LFPKIEVQTLESGSDRGELTALLLDASVAVETFALPSDKLLAGLAALRAGVPMVHAAVLRSHVQVLTVRPGQSGGCLRCLYEVLPVQGAIPAAALVGVLGPVVALAGALAGAEALRLLRGDKGAYEGHQANLDASTAAFRLVRIARRPGCPACGGAPGTDSLEPR
jgi:molybdopterin/thiamine biosynthesis adenylyltransferase